MLRQLEEKETLDRGSVDGKLQQASLRLESRQRMREAAIVTLSVQRSGHAKAVVPCLGRAERVPENGGRGPESERIPRVGPEDVVRNG